MPWGSGGSGVVSKRRGPERFARPLSLVDRSAGTAGEGGIQWIEAVVIRDLSGPPNFWDEQTIRHNVLKKYSSHQIRGTTFDAQSIMCYAFRPLGR
jgi:hypothetical protein